MKKPISIRMVHVLAVILFAAATLVDSEHCPPADNISPCVCHGDPDIKDIICKTITTVDYLRPRLGGHHFKAPIPKLVITNLQSSMLPSDALGDIKVIDLEISDGYIRHIAKLAFSGQPLLSLRLDRIRMKDVPTAALDFLWEQLKILSMSGNVLTKLEHNSMRLLLRVHELTLSRNEISEIATNSLPPNVQSLWISRNNFTTFNGALRHTKNLQKLDASFNKLTSIKGEFVGVSGLKWLILDHNHISDISGSFSDVPSLKKLSLAVNRIQEIGEALADLRHLKRLNLAHNAIKNLNRRMFENLIDLYDLNLSENLLTAFQLCPTLIPLRSLGRLKIQNSKLTNLSEDCFDNNRNLRFVDLSRNQLSDLWLTYATNLDTLDISFNNFSSLSNIYLHRTGSAALILEDNQWLCSRERKWMLKDLYMRGYQFPNGDPGCLPISEKAPNTSNI